MSRAERLLALAQVLRRHRAPVTGAQLSAELGVSLRTVYRDIVSLQSQGARIDGERGIGFLMRPGYMLPPLMFAQEEIEALALASRWLAKHADARLAVAAQSAIGKIAAVLPPDLRIQFDTSTLLVGPSTTELGPVDLALLRQAIRSESKLVIDYVDAGKDSSTRTVWPFALSYFERVRVLVSWCELRQGFRHFRCDRISTAQMLETRYPRRRQDLMREWKEQEGVAPV
ncbi:MAG: YafY family protein [Pseudomonadota bacterium]